MHDDTDPSAERTDLSRRRFARAGLAGGVVLGSLASKPVLGASTYHCTVSGQVSGNLSRPGVAATCVIGQGPDYWKEESWPSGFVKGTLPNKKCKFPSNSNLVRGTNFNRYTPSSGFVTPLIDAFFNQSSGSPESCSVVLTRTSNRATMLQVLSTADSDHRYQLGRVVVASLLNAATYPNYPATAHSIIAMFNATFNGGSYFPTGDPAVSWDRMRVIAYLESLYQLPG